MLPKDPARHAAYVKAASERKRIYWERYRKKKADIKARTEQAKRDSYARRVAKSKATISAKREAKGQQYRPCMCCHRDFFSDGPHNRLCANCRGGSVIEYGTIRLDNFA